MCVASLTDEVRVAPLLSRAAQRSTSRCSVNEEGKKYFTPSNIVIMRANARAGRCSTMDKGCGGACDNSHTCHDAFKVFKILLAFLHLILSEMLRTV